MATPQCERCGTTEDLNNGMCGFGIMCQHCLRVELTQGGECTLPDCENPACRQRRGVKR